MGLSPLAVMQFQSTHPLRGATWRKGRGQHRHLISIHAPLAGCDRDRGGFRFRTADFNPRTPCGVRRQPRDQHGLPGRFQSTHPLRGATFVAAISIASARISIHAPLAGCDMDAMDTVLTYEISIHAPLAGCDLRGQHGSMQRLAISIHAPLAGCDNNAQTVADTVQAFQSTHPLRGATVATVTITDKDGISIHAPLAGCDMPYTADVTMSGTFQSTHPLRGATELETALAKALEISIHAPLAGCDQRQAPAVHARVYFNPRTPCGVRPWASCW